MVDLQGASGFAFALSQLTPRFPAHVVSFHLSLVTLFAEMSVSPAEPLGDGAAELALKFNEI